MSKKLMRFVSLFMVVLMVFTLCVGPSPAEAVGPIALLPELAAVAPETIAAIIAFVLGLIGVKFADKGKMYDVVNDLMQRNNDIRRWINSNSTIIQNTEGGLLNQQKATVELTSPENADSFFDLCDILAACFPMTGEQVTSIPDTSKLTVADITALTNVPSSDGLFGLDSCFHFNTSDSPLVLTTALGYTYKYFQRYNDVTKRSYIEWSVVAPSGFGSSYFIEGKNFDYYYGSNRYWTDCIQYFGFNLVSDDVGNQFLNPFMVYSGTDYYNKSVTRIVSIDSVIPGINGLYNSFPLNDLDFSYGSTSVPYEHDVFYEWIEFKQQLESISKSLEQFTDGTGALKIDISPALEVIEGGKPNNQPDDEENPRRLPAPIWWPDVWPQLGLNPDSAEIQPPGYGSSDPDNPSKPPSKIGLIPDIGNIWRYVTQFLKDAAAWMALWFTGFQMTASPLQNTLWALLVISIVLGVLGVILK